MARLTAFAGVGCWLLAIAVGGVDPAAVPRLATALARPIALPFLWRSLDDASRAGDPAEAFARAQLLLEAVPGWTDGYTVFAYRYALDGQDQALPQAQRTRAAADRLQVALAVLDAARASCPGDEADLYTAMGWLVDLAARRHDDLGAALGEDPAVLGDRYLVAAEHAGASRLVREHRLFRLPRLVAALLRAGDRTRALDLLAEGIRRCDELREQDVAAEWRNALAGVRRCLEGDPGVDRAALLADPRLESMAPFLR